MTAPTPVQMKVREGQESRPCSAGTGGLGRDNFSVTQSRQRVCRSDFELRDPGGACCVYGSTSSELLFPFHGRERVAGRGCAENTREKSQRVF